MKKNILKKILAVCLGCLLSKQHSGNVIIDNLSYGLMKQEITDTIFKQKLDNDLVIIGTRQLNNDFYIWQTKIVNQKNNKELILLEDRIANNDTWKEMDLRGESPSMLYTISGACLEEKDIYLLLNKFGEMTLYKYHFTAPETYEIKHKVIQTYFTTPAYGKIISYAETKKIKDNIFLFVHFGQQYNFHKTALYMVGLSSFNIKEIVFQENPHVVAAIFVSESSKSWLRQMERDITFFQKEKSPEVLDRMNKIKKHLDKPYYLKEFDSDRIIQKKEINSILSLGFEFYCFFDEKINNQQIDLNDVEKKIKDILSYVEINNHIKVLDYFSDSLTGSIVYFFYSDHQNKLQIIRYKKDHPLWMVGNYKEEVF